MGVPQNAGHPGCIKQDILLRKSTYVVGIRCLAAGAGAWKDWKKKFSIFFLHFLRNLLYLKYFPNLMLRISYSKAFRMRSMSYLSKPSHLEAQNTLKNANLKNFEDWRPVEPIMLMTSKISIISMKLAPPVARSIIFTNCENASCFTLITHRVCWNIVFCLRKLVFFSTKKSLLTK